MEYQSDKLKKYINNSVLRIVNKDFHIRLSKKLSEKYDSGKYSNAVKQLKRYIKQIKKLNIKYPSNSNPIFYVYLVPDENFIKLLQYPYKKAKAGGRPVNTYDLDSFNTAYGLSQNMFENFPKQTNLSQDVNDLHEFAHLVHSQFFNKNRFISEGFAEALPLYTMDYENKFKEHREILKNMEEKQILSAQELISKGRKGTFDGQHIIPKSSCSFDFSYISSYLWVRGCLEMISSQFNLNRVESTQKFLEILRNSRFTNEWLVFDIADILRVSKKDLLEKKVLQLATLDKL